LIKLLWSPFRGQKAPMKPALPAHMIETVPEKPATCNINPQVLKAKT